MAQTGEIILTPKVWQAIAKVVAFALNNAKMQRQESIYGEIINFHPYTLISGDVLGNAFVFGEVSSGK